MNGVCVLITLKVKTYSYLQKTRKKVSLLTVSGNGNPTIPTYFIGLYLCSICRWCFHQQPCVIPNVPFPFLPPNSSLRLLRAHLRSNPLFAIFMPLSPLSIYPPCGKGVWGIPSDEFSIRADEISIRLPEFYLPLSEFLIPADEFSIRADEFSVHLNKILIRPPEFHIPVKKTLLRVLRAFCGSTAFGFHLLIC